MVRLGGADPDSTDSRKRSAAWFAAEQGHVDVLRYLAKQGAALHRPKKLTSSMAPSSPLAIAATLGRNECAAALIGEMGCDTTEQTGLHGETAVRL